MKEITVNAEWDAEVEVWVATSEDVPGLVAESATFEALRPKVLAMISDLIELNKMSFQSIEIPIHFVGHSLDRMVVPSAV